MGRIICIKSFDTYRNVTKQKLGANATKITAK